MYNPKSLKAEEFISNEEVMETLQYAQENKNNLELINAILLKAIKRKGITHKEAAVLMDCEIEEKNQEIYELAQQIKKDFYGNPETPFRVLTKKGLTPDAAEIARNSRSRSARLRIAEKI
jgi:hypothetical protein